MICALKEEKTDAASSEPHCFHFVLAWRKQEFTQTKWTIIAARCSSALASVAPECIASDSGAVTEGRLVYPFSCLDEGSKLETRHPVLLISFSKRPLKVLQSKIPMGLQKAFLPTWDRAAFPPISHFQHFHLQNSLPPVSPSPARCVMQLARHTAERRRA